MKSFALIVPALFAGACATDDAGPAPIPELTFEMFSPYNTQPFDEAWTAARANPSDGVRYTFPVVSDGLGDDVELRLVVGHSTTGSTPLEAAGDVLLTDVFPLATAYPDADGRAEFPELTVSSTGAQSDTATIPASYLCGATVIAVRALRTNATAAEFLTATWAMTVTDACD